MKRNASLDPQRASGAGSLDCVELRTLVEAQRTELCALLGSSVRLEIGALPAPCAAVAHARRGEVVDLLRHLALDARDAMPGGGTLTILAGSVRTDGAEPSLCAALVLREVRADQPPRVATPLRKGRSLGLDAACGIIERASGHLLISCRGRETVVTICFPPAP